MDREQIRKLLGGYATGTLTAGEQQALFAAALEDQELFDELAREQSLRDLLQDPSARAHLLAAMDERPLPWYRRYWRPLLLTAASAACLATAGIYLNRPKPEMPKPVLQAELKVETPREALPAAPPAVAPAPALVPAPQPHTRTSRRAVANEERPALAPAAKDEAEASLRTPIPPAAAPPVVPEARGALGANSLEEAVQMSQQNAQISLQHAQSMFFAGQQQQVASAAAAPYLGVKWTILRQRDGGDFVEVAADQLAAGDAVKLRLIPNEDGFVSITEAGAVILRSAPVRRLQPFDSPVIRGVEVSTKVVTVQFARSPAMRTVQAAAGQQSATDTRDHATYVLKATAAPGEPVSLKIVLVFR
jgi:hypothetical protein